MISLDDYIYSVCSLPYENSECVKTDAYDFPITNKPMIYAVNNKSFIDTRFAVSEDKTVFQILIYKCKDRKRELAFTGDCKKITSGEVKEAYAKILEEIS